MRIAFRCQKKVEMQAGEIVKKYFHSEIEWISYEEGGRKHIPPQGTHYCPIIRIEDEKYQNWSLDFICPDFNKTNIVDFTFLAEDAPFEKIKSDKSYDVYEGAKKVAVLKIISCNQQEDFPD